MRVFFSGAERVLAGAALGYLIGSVLASLLYALGSFSLAAVLGASAGLALLLTVLIRGESAREEALGSNLEGHLLLLAFALALGLVALPFLKVGAAVPEGIAYRAYFSADSMTHLAVMAELQKRSFPPVDPFYAGAPLAYYWLFFLFPALFGEWLGNQPAVLATYVAGDLLFAGLALCAARRFAASTRDAFFAVVAALAAASYEGLATLVHGVMSGQASAGFREQNVDAFSRWSLELTSLDGLYRSLLYTPQHLFSYSLLLVLILLIWREAPLGRGRAVLAGVLLGAMAGTSIVTAMLAGPWACLARLSLVRARAAVAESLWMAGVAALFLAWFFRLGFFAEAGVALHLRAPGLAELPAIALLEVGPLLLLGAPALRDARVRPVAVLCAMALGAVLFLDVEGGNGVWMAWRAGSVLLTGLMLLVASGVARWGRVARLAILGPAFLTTALDLYNAQDVTNREESAGAFPWTLVVSKAELEALAWVRTETPRESVVQLDARVRGAGPWALVPALGQRRMAYGYPIFLLNPHKYTARGRRLRPIFNSEDAALAHRLAVEAGIRFLYVGRPEREEPQNHCEKFWGAPELFTKAFANSEVTVFEVKPP